MNPESEYPELSTMKSNEIFVESADIWLNCKKIAAIEIKKIINVKDKNDIAKELKLKYSGDACYMRLISK